ncbi:MAG: tetratricopeptide repeat protein [Myxococcota bacterium]
MDPHEPERGHLAGPSSTTTSLEIGEAPTTTSSDEGAPLPRPPLGWAEDLAQARVFEALFREAAEPTTLGRYAVLDTLGEGGMGVVLRAFDRELDRPVALKVLHEDLDEDHTARLRREAQAMAKLSHPNVVQVYEVGQVEGRTFVAMELVKGQTAKQWIQQRPRPEWRACVNMFVLLGEGLAAAHERGLVHRDFKPGNAIIDDKGRPRVLDFGLVRHEGDPEHASTVRQRAQSGPQSAVPLDTSLTETGMVLGTPAYMPPEQMAGRPTDARSDQFSFCASLYEAVYSERPYDGNSMAALMMSMVKGGVRPAPKGTRVPAALRRALLRGLASEPDQRWPSMEALLQELRRLAAPRGRRWIAAGLTVGLVAIGAGVAYGEYLQIKDRCTGARAQLEGVWDDARRQEIRDAILATALPYAPLTWERVQPRLEAYAQQWATRHTEVCEATSVRGEQSEAHMGLRMGCLQDRRRHLRAAVDELSRADPTAVENAVDLVSGLPGLPRCDDLEALSATVPPPEDPTVARDVEALRERLAKIEAQQEAGRYGPALQEVESVVEQAHALAYEPLLAEARARRGVLYRKNGRYDEAERDLLEAYELAMEHRHDPVALDTVQELAYVTGVLQTRATEGQLWSRAAVAHAKRSADELELAQSLNNQGGVLTKHGQYAPAQQAHERALEIRTRVLGKDDPVVAISLQNLALVLGAQGEYAQAQRYSEQALQLRETTLGPDHPRVAKSLSSLGSLLQTQGKYEQAQRHYERALQISERALGPDHPDIATRLSHLAGTHWSQGRYEQALHHYERALQVSETALGPDHPDVAIPLVNVGYMLSVQGRYEQAQRVQERALRIQQAALGPDHPDVAKTLDMLGNVLGARGRHAQARAHLQRALSIQQKALGADHLTVAGTLSDLAITLDVLGEHDQARRLHERALRIREQAPGVDPRFVAYSLTNLASTLAAHAEHEQARQHYERALRMLEKAVGVDHPDVARPLIGLAEIVLAEGDHDAAQEYAARVLTIRERADGAPAELAEARFLLARVQWSDRGKREEARALAQRAREGYAGAGETAKAELTAVQAWLAEHRPR